LDIKYTAKEIENRRKAKNKEDACKIFYTPTHKGKEGFWPQPAESMGSRSKRGFKWVFGKWGNKLTAVARTEDVQTFLS
jgi:hypothetical protein